MIDRDSRSEQWLRDYGRVAAAIAWLDTNCSRQPSVAELAAALHLSAGHLHRTFSRFAGVPPHRFLRWLTVGAAKELLRDRATVLDTVAATGLSSPGRLHDLTVTLDAVTPGEIGQRGAGLTIRYGFHATPLGEALVATTDRGVLALRFVDAPTPSERLRDELAAEWPRAQTVEDPHATRPVIDYLAVLLGASSHPPRGTPGDGSALRVMAVGTNLQVKVWEALLRVPADRVVTYGEVARAVGQPSAARAVANAVGRNPVAALIPCHRVLRATGELGGYRWGTTRKRALLAREAARHRGPRGHAEPVVPERPVADR